MAFKSQLGTRQSKKTFSNNFETNTGVTDQAIFEEITYLGAKIATITGYEDNTKVVTLYSETFTYSGSKVTQVQTVIHNPEDNSVTKTITDTLVYSGSKLETIDRVVS